METFELDEGLILTEDAEEEIMLESKKNNRYTCLEMATC